MLYYYIIYANHKENVSFGKFKYCLKYNTTYLYLKHTVVVRINDTPGKYDQKWQYKINLHWHGVIYIPVCTKHIQHVCCQKALFLFHLTTEPQKIKTITNADFSFTAMFDHIYQGCH